MEKEEEKPDTGKVKKKKMKAKNVSMKISLVVDEFSFNKKQLCFCVFSLSYSSIQPAAPPSILRKGFEFKLGKGEEFFVVFLSIKT